MTTRTTARKATKALYSIEWLHPNLGEVREYTCERHRTIVGRALTTLGIGCLATRSPSGAHCHRCGFGGENPRMWLPQAVVDSSAAIPGRRRETRAAIARM